MSKFKLSRVSQRNLIGVHPHLQSVVWLAITMTEVDFRVIEGLRTEAEQRRLVKAGASQTMRSRHLTGHAVDLAAMVGGQIRWDWPLYDKIAQAMKGAALQEGVALEWGGDWKSFKDGPHFQLPWRQYP